jgi:pimeloyl-ACP methyl ester carboxylesterase
MREKAAQFGEWRTMTGIVTEPPAGTAPATAFVFLNAGVVHRVGPNRLHVTAARRLADDGFLSVRFDLSGLGDSEARRDTLPFDQAAVREVRDVMTEIEREYRVSRFVLAGLCSGAVAAFRGALADDRVVGAVLINPQGFVQSAEWQAHVVGRAQARRYWSQKVFRAESWRRALTGRSNYRHLIEVVKRRTVAAFRPPSAVAQVARGLSTEFQRLTERGVRIMLACSEGDLGIDYLNIILGEGFDRLQASTLRTVLLPAGDHSLTFPVTQERFFAALHAWAGEWRTAPRPSLAFAPGVLEVPVSSSHAPLQN